MSQITIQLRSPKLIKELKEFWVFLKRYFRSRGYRRFSQFEDGKSFFVDLLYKKRGRYTRPFLHFGTITLIFVVITFGPLVFRKGDDRPEGQEAPTLLAVAEATSSDFSTVQAEEVRQYRGGEIIVHTVQEGETVSSIAERYNLDVSTVLWENNLAAKATLKPGQQLNILPVDGVKHKVAKGETIYTIGKKYALDEAQVQVIVDYPFNEFLNDETFDLAVGQSLVIPDGVKPSAIAPSLPRTTYANLTPDAGAVAATGSLVWPASGRITQGYRFYHRAIDIANKAGGSILAADSGVVTISGWIDSSGYGNRVIIDHGNGIVTLYAHMSVVQVVPGQRVNRGDVIGQMGNTGRSTGTHLHFEVRRGGVALDPLGFLN